MTLQRQRAEADPDVGGSKLRMQRHLSRDDEIIDKAADLFRDHGYHQTSMEDIAAAVGLAKPSLYHYFDGKGEILASIHNEFITPLIEKQEARVSVTTPADQCLLGIMTDIIDLNRTHPGYVRVFHDYQRELLPERAEEIRRKRDCYEELVQDVVMQLQASNGSSSLHAKTTTLAVFGMCNWAYHWYRPGGSLEPTQIAHMMWRLALHGLAGR